MDSAFNIYIGDTNNQRVRMVTHSSGIIGTLAGTGVKTFTDDGAARAAALARPQGLAVDSLGNVYLADSDNNRIRTISGGNVTMIAGDSTEGSSGDSGSATKAALDTPQAVAVSGTAVLLADTGTNRTREINNGIVNTTGGAPTCPII